MRRMWCDQPRSSSEHDPKNVTGRYGGTYGNPDCVSVDRSSVGFDRNSVSAG